MSREAFFRRRVQAVQHEGLTYYVRPLSGAHLETLLASESDERIDGVRALSRVCCYCACDETGQRIFSDDDLSALRDEGDFGMIKTIAEAAMEASGLGNDEGNA